MYGELVSNCPQGSGPPGKVPGNFWDNAGKFQGHVREKSNRFPVNFRKMSWHLMGTNSNEDNYIDLLVYLLSPGTPEKLQGGLV